MSVLQARTGYTQQEGARHDGPSVEERLGMLESLWTTLTTTETITSRFLTTSCLVRHLSAPYRHHKYKM